jgi:peptidoglycan endopeptidase LytE
VHVIAAFAAALVLAFAAAPAARAAALPRYVIAPHDTLFSIARRFRVPLPLLARVNGIHDPSKIRVGDVLLIPPAVAQPVSAAPATPPALIPPAARAPQPSRHGVPGPDLRGAFYIVRPGDTLYHLAVTHGTTAAALLQANGLTSPAIRAGQVIRLPKAAAPAAGPPAAAPLSAETGPAASEPAPGSGPPVPPSGHEPQAPPVEPNTPARPAFPPEPAFSPPLPVRSALAARVRASALQYLGTPYVWGGTTPAGVDCSGLVYLVYAPYVPTLPRTSYEQWNTGAPVDRAALMPGDLVFFNTDGTGASHVGIYIGDGEFVHPAASAQRVVIDRLDAPYYLLHYLGARRVL